VDETIAGLKALAERLERVSTGYPERYTSRRDEDWYVLKLQEEVGELTQAWLRLTERGRRVATDDAALRNQLEDETTDLLCQLLLFARRFDIDLGASIKRKWLLFDRGAPTGPRSGGAERHEETAPAAPLLRRPSRTDAP
jgi:NTP pyrophosphatase (non-canonical NTP hydrolase)